MVSPLTWPGRGNNRHCGLHSAAESYIYVGHVQHGPSPIRGVSTSDTAFVDWFPFGPVGEPTRISSFDEFSQVFGGLHPQSQASYSIYQYFQQGGAVAWVVRAGMTADDAAFSTSLVTAMGDLQRELVAAAAEFCEAQRAFLLVDPPASITTAAQMRTWLTDTDGISSSGATRARPPRGASKRASSTSWSGSHR